MDRLERQAFAPNRDEMARGGSAEKTLSAEDAILNTEQIRQILSQNRLSEYPVLERATELARGAASLHEGSLRKRKEWTVEIIREVKAREGKATNDEELLKDFAEYLADTALSHIRLVPAYRGLDAERQQAFARKVGEQMNFLFENFEKTSDLLSAQQKTALIQQLQEEERHKRDERKWRSEELLASKEAASRWLYGVARGELEHSGGKVADAARNLARSTKATELVKHHNLNLFQYADEEFRDIDARERDQRRDRAGAKLPVAVLLQAFATPRTMRSDAHTIQNFPGVHLLQTINFWLNARFATELPAGVYEQTVEDEERYKQKQKEHPQNRRSYFDEPGLSIRGEKNVEHERGRSSAYSDSNVAGLWWDMPLWKQWKLLKPHIKGEIEKVQGKSRGFVPRRFLEYIDGLVSKEVQATRQKQGGISTNLEKVIRLQEIKQLFNVDFVMSPKDRTAEIKRRQDEQAKQRLLTDRFRFRW